MTLAVMNQKRAEILTNMVKAMHNEDSDAYTSCLNELAQNIEENILERANELAGNNDAQILAQRGVRQLTSSEKKYYEKLAEAFRASDTKQALTNPELVMPETVINSVFEDLRTQHPLLEKINFQNTMGMIKFLVNKNGYVKAVWGKLTDEITKELESSFSEVDMTFLKLSAFIPVSQAMLDLGPSWLDTYVRDIMYDALANGLEDGIINSLRTDQGPIGMIANLTSGSAQSGYVQYTAKSATVIKDFQPATLGAEIAKLAVDDNNKTRTIRDVIYIVNPVDYFTKVFPATTVMGGDGTYRNDVLPYPMTIIQSPAVASGKAVLGLGYRYFAGIGMSSKDGKLEFDDSCQFLEDNRVYKIKLYGNGMPMDNNAFQYHDISQLKPAVVKVEVTNTDPITTTVEGTVKTQAAG